MLNKTCLAIVMATSLTLGGCNSSDEIKSAVEVELRIMETSDLHANIMDYNYYTSRVDNSIGLARTASLIKQARLEVKNSVLVDNGDLLQGSPMGDYIAHTFQANNQLIDTHPAYKAMNTLDYAVGNIGNHEFNYGLDFLDQATAAANFPYISANVYCEIDNCFRDVKAGEPLFKPYIITEQEVIDNQGAKHTIKIGYIGFVPPQIKVWDKQNLDGKVIAKGIVESAERYVPKMKDQGADVIIAIPHSGIGSSENPGDMNAENATWALTTVAGIDAIMFGHSHSVFPSAQFSDVAKVNIETGTINGVAAVMPGRWGDNLGIIDLTLRQEEGKWRVSNSLSQARPIFIKETDKVAGFSVNPDKEIQTKVASDHQATLDYVNAPIGKSSADMYSFLSLVQDDPTVQIVSNAQIDAVTKAAAKIDTLKHLPVLSAAAPFKAGGRHRTSSDADSYVQVAAGELSYKNAADLYLYPNTLVAVKVTGKQVKDWLECSANQFNQIDPNSAASQSLINWETHRTYNFDVIDGVNYKIDVTQPNKFDGDCAMVNADANRIVELSYTDDSGTIFKGEEFANKSFLIATNNFRAFGNKFAGTGADYIAMELPDTNREALTKYITQLSELNGEVDPSANNNWQFKTIESSTKLDIRFETQDSPLADTFIKQNQQRPMTKLEADSIVSGFAIYSIDLSNDLSNDLN
ncbi:2',3'-cyclic-nucleotide 2'-phosphodiesterase/3'-nucleotidase precursor [Shewanella sp. P1-14-1]|uniref:bifunctional 2',3'-cyclic-nucleotide 2'-phosphodiesterase/3'-nucleotidase n=1 Tax=Shewanella sp. P1-14-1 TaxID=1723761 RepID=UPI0006D66B93|nr:bifunctional 2',3'-cyclic-nucleotide 2'-phosphodiesterase/3'-nucleotidase [Shewanella sp. P1-14-1]KPZ72617.1 2',3'-cyclic-nucleotide 2'-phosphodiesterase/3'-nucleotidase precursor [Shewanella sp. P1-14-1]